MPSSASRGRRRSPASLVLAHSGTCLADIAEALCVSPSSVSMQLAGYRRPHPSLLPVIRALAGASAAEQVSQMLEPGKGEL